ncbi:beta-carotene hydroxylase 1 [Zostera marina]|uniref:beta-carotene 3-hydroxylase n=1 Tax=Zostera marina TaxID=29655 RepID=A0A0K9NHK4_ZOSMR|nr:beta-carotene hydroxylase 1 [Zostera marina]
MGTAVGISAVAASMETAAAASTAKLGKIQYHFLSPTHLRLTDSGLQVSHGLMKSVFRRNNSRWTWTASSSGNIVCVLKEHHNMDVKYDETSSTVGSTIEETVVSISQRGRERMEKKKKERRTYLVAAVVSSLGFTAMAIAAVYYRFSWQMKGSEIPVSEIVGTFALSVGAAVGMEFWARWAHKALWHASLWHMHESHHRPREGQFELNDVFAIINAVPAISLLSFGFFHSGLLPGLCFGAGLGITLYGMSYMFVHDGLVHRRFPVGPVANVPYLRKVASAHQIHHTDKFDGVPYGLFLGPKELEEVGGDEELQKEIARRIKATSTSST